MKKWISLLICIFICTFACFAFTGCGSEAAEAEAEKNIEENAANESTAGASGDLDIDLTVMSSTMVYSQVYDMVYNPDNYKGKVVKMAGNFSSYHDDNTGKDYFACIIQDATACCSQGIEFELSGTHVFPDDYPAEGEEFCVQGTFDAYYEDGYIYTVLREAEFI